MRYHEIIHIVERDTHADDRTLPMGVIDRNARASALGYTVDAYHGTSNDFTAFRHVKKAHFGFHFGSTPKAAEAKLRSDRTRDAAIKRGSDPEPLYDPQERQPALDRLRQVEADLSNKLAAIKQGIAKRATPASNEEIAAAIDRGDDDEVGRLLAIGHPTPTAEEAAQIRRLKDQIEDIEHRMRVYFSHTRPGERIIPVRLRLGKTIRMKDTNWGDPERIAADNRELRLPSNSLSAIRQELQRRGYDSIVYQNEVEDAGADSYIVFSPSQIRSRHARFNPKSAKSGDIMETIIW